MACTVLLLPYDLTLTSSLYPGNTLLLQSKTNVMSRGLFKDAACQSVFHVEDYVDTTILTEPCGRLRWEVCIVPDAIYYEHIPHSKTMEISSTGLVELIVLHCQFDSHNIQPSFFLSLFSSKYHTLNCRAGHTHWGRLQQQDPKVGTKVWCWPFACGWQSHKEAHFHALLTLETFAWVATHLRSFRTPLSSPKEATNSSCLDLVEVNSRWMHCGVVGCHAFGL